MDIIDSIFVTAAAEPEAAKVAHLAQNHGFLKGLMQRVLKHFQTAGAGAVRILKSGGVWFSLLGTVVAAVSFLFDARRLRHYQMQPGLGKMRAFGVGLSLIFFIGAFLSFFKKIAMAWQNQSEDEVEKAKAAALLARLSDAERKVVMARAQARTKPATASVIHARAFEMVAPLLAVQGFDTEVYGSGFDLLKNARLRILQLSRKYGPAELFHKVVVTLERRKKEDAQLTPAQKRMRTERKNYRNDAIKLVLILVALVGSQVMALRGIGNALYRQQSKIALFRPDVKAARRIFAEMDWADLRRNTSVFPAGTYTEVRKTVTEFMKRTAQPGAVALIS
jgi:hypothetical protein